MLRLLRLLWLYCLVQTRHLSTGHPTLDKLCAEA